MMRSMAKDRSKQLDEITFHCSACYRSFKAPPDRVEPAPEEEHHPYAYFGICPGCDRECEQVHWEKNLIKAHVKATGPKTEEGKAASAANLEGHPTAEEALRTRFNAMKHGLSARTATYFPAKPDGYSFCTGCDVDRVYCGQQSACVKKTELFMLHHAAFEQRNPRHLSGIYSEMQAAVFSVVQTILQEIVADGVKIATPRWFVNKEGKIEVVEYIDESGDRRILHESIVAHPLFRPLGELLTRAGLSLSDMGMTQKAIEAEEDEMGRLSASSTNKESLNAFQERQTQLLSNLADKVMRANQKTESDPILIEYQQENGGS